MSNLKLLRKILRLKSMKVTDFCFKNRDTELHLAVKPYKNGCRCPTCGRRGRIVHQTTEPRRWEDLALMGLHIVLWYAPKEIQCPTHGRVQEEIPWAPASARISYRLEWRICTLCQIMTQKAAAEILLLPTSTLSNLLHRVITRVRHGHTIRGLTTLGVDEISYCKGRKFATLVYDLDRARVLWVGPGKGRDTIDCFFNDCLSTGQKARVAWASCDMSPAYIGLYPDFPKSTNTLYLYILRAKLSVRPAQVDGIYVNIISHGSTPARTRACSDTTPRPDALYRALSRLDAVSDQAHVNVTHCQI